MENNYIFGEELQLFLGGKSIAKAKTHTLTITSDTIDVSSKDDGFYGASIPGKINWEISAENIYTEKAFDELYAKAQARQVFEVVFGRVANYNAEGLGENDAWTPDSVKHTTYTGKVTLTNMTLNANNGEITSFSATLKGVGALKQVKATSPEP